MSPFLYKGIINRKLSERKKSGNTHENEQWLSSLGKITWFQLLSPCSPVFSNNSTDKHFQMIRGWTR